MTIVIMDFDHDELVTPIGDKTKAAVTIGFKEALANAGVKEEEYYWGSQKETAFTDNDNYSESPLRNYLNQNLLNALPSTFKLTIKEVNKKNSSRHSTAKGSDPLLTQDKIWLLSYPEIYGNTSYSNYQNGNTSYTYEYWPGWGTTEVLSESIEFLEGAQYEYMKTTSNRTKYKNNNGTASSSTAYYWLRSPASNSGGSLGYSFIYMGSSGPATNNYNGIRELAPCFCL